MISVLKDFTVPYSRAESWVYDTVIAPALGAFDGEVLARWLPELPRGGSLLEVGCGGGQLLAKIAARRPDLGLTGLDLSPEQVARARRRTATAGERVRCVQGSALDLPFPADSFDAILSVASIKHWPDPRRGLEECARVLRPGGGLVIVEADRGCRDADIARFVAAWRLPTAMRPLAAAMFRTVVAGRSFDLEDARALADGLALADRRVERLPGVPGWILSGRKR